MSGPILITGANGTFAALACKALAAHDRRLICTVRDPAKIRAQPGALPKESASVEYVALELSDLASVRRFTASLRTRVESGELDRLGVVVCSAAIQQVKATPQLTGDGYETTYAVNHVAHFALIAGLLPIMASDGVVVIIGSDAHRSDYSFFAEKPGYQKLDSVLKVTPGSDPAAKSRDLGLQRYGSSKLFQMIIAHELARRLEAAKSRLKVLIYEPGSMGGTGLFRDQSAWAQTLLKFALRQVWLVNWIPELNASTPEASAAQLVKIVEDGASNAAPVGADAAVYYRVRGNIEATSDECNDAAHGAELWADTARLLGLDPDAIVIQ